MAGLTCSHPLRTEETQQVFAREIDCYQQIHIFVPKDIEHMNLQT